MKLLLLLWSIFIPLATSPADENRDSFNDEVEEKYSSYKEEINVTTSYYDLLVVKGIFNGKPAYGICFTSSVADQYRLLLEREGLIYTTEKTKRNDIYAIAIEANVDTKLRIVDKNGNSLELSDDILEMFKISSFNEEIMIAGQNGGGKFSKLYSDKRKISSFLIIIIVSISVIFASAIIIFCSFLAKKGLFDAEKRRNGIVNVKEIIKQHSRPTVEENVWAEYLKEEEEKKLLLEEDIKKIDDVKEYLVMQGYNTNYNTLKEEEKNKIMLELIKLKDKDLIEDEIYYKETAELWKN